MLQLLIDNSSSSTSLIVQNENYLSTSVMLIRKTDWFDKIIDEWELVGNSRRYNKSPYDQFALCAVLSKSNVRPDQAHHKQLMTQIRNRHQSRFHNTELPFILSNKYNQSFNSGDSNCNYLLLYGTAYHIKYLE